MHELELPQLRRTGILQDTSRGSPQRDSCPTAPAFSWHVLLLSSLMSGFADTTYSVEYAKSNRAACKVCKAKIDKDALRIGTTAPGPGDYIMTSWRHLEYVARPCAPR